MKNSFVAIAIVVAILISGGAGYAMRAERNVASTLTTTQIITKTATKTKLFIWSPFFSFPSEHDEH